jgi:hypothetical protein
MANQLWDKGREGFLDGSIDWDTDDIRVMLVKSTYTFDGNDVYVTDLTPATNDNGRSAALESKTVTNGVANAGSTSLTATDAVECNALVIFKHTGSDATARLIAHIATATGFPITPGSGSSVNVTWDSGSNKIFKL